MRTLRKVCGIGRWSYRKRLAKTCRNAKAWIPSKLIHSFAFTCLVGTVIVLYIEFGRESVDTRAHNLTTLREACSGKEISVLIFPANDPPTSQLPSGQDVFDKVCNSIVSVRVFVDYVPVCSGSGSVIGADDLDMLYIITNKHVIQNSSISAHGKKGDRVRVEVSQHSGAKFEASLDFYSRQHDLAILAVKGMKDYAKPLQMNLKSGLRVGQAIYAIGSPIGLDHSFTAGVVSALRETYLQTDATVHSGSSGGPLVDQHGALCAVVTEGHATKDYGFALYSDVILEVLEERKKLKLR